MPACYAPSSQFSAIILNQDAGQTDALPWKEYVHNIPTKQDLHLLIGEVKAPSREEITALREDFRQFFEKLEVVEGDF